MSVQSVITDVAGDLKSFYAKLAADVRKAKAAWSVLSSPQTRAILLKVGSDAITLGKDAEQAAVAGGISLPLDGQVLADIKQLVADAKAGDGVILADLKVLGITL